MENLETKLHTSLPNRLGSNLTHVVLKTYPTLTLYTLHHNAKTQLNTHQLDLSKVSKSQYVTANSMPIALTLHNELPLLACRDGSLMSAHDAEHLGDFTDDDPSKSGILAAASSPDGCLLLVVSPISVSVLDADFEITAELPCDRVASDAQVAWRSDGNFFVVLRKYGESTVGFVADRTCRLVKPLEVEDLHEVCCVDWEPRPGGLVTISHGNKMLFFERNGLRHRRSDFDAGRTVTLLRWSVDARALLIFGEGVLDIWMRRNYVWYCKKRLMLRDFVDALWDEDDPRLLRLFLSNGEVRLLRVSIVPSTCLSVERGPLVAVTHGTSVVFTNLAAGLVPPPMNHGHLKFDAGVEATCCLPCSNIIGCLLADGSFEIAVLIDAFGKQFLSTDPLGDHTVPAVRKKWRLPVQHHCAPRTKLQLRAPVFVAEDIVAVVQQQTLWVDREVPNDVVQIYRMRQRETDGLMVGKYVADGQITSMCASRYSPGSITIATNTGSLVHLSVDPDSGDCVEVCRTTCKAAETACSLSNTCVKGGPFLSIVQSEEGRLELVDSDMARTTLLCDECTSFTTLGEFLVYTTKSNVFFCLSLRKRGTKSDDNTDAFPAPFPPLARANESAATFSAEGAARPIDRGSVIVGALQDEISVVLQAPRGNLESIVPRPAVLHKIKRLVECENYGQAFALCRRQRIGMNHVVDGNFPLFLKNTGKFVSQLGNSEHLSVFMTLLTGDISRVNSVCRAVVMTLRDITDPGTFTSAILTGMMRQEPRDFEGALQEVKRASIVSKEDGQAAIDYLFVLVKNQELIYEHALGTYDLELASFVAESSQMDPATYHQELSSLRKKAERERRVAIDLKLQRYNKALVHLYNSGRKNFHECVSLCLTHALYDTALPLFRGEKDTMRVLLKGYGNHLKNERHFDEAAAVFRQIDDSHGACDCYRLGGRWQLAAYSTASSNLPQDEKIVLWNAIATDLEENGRTVDSARVRADFLGEIGTALTLLVEGEEWEAAFEIAARKNASTSEKGVQDTDRIRGVTGGIELSATKFKGNIDENRRKLENRRQRLTTLRNTKEIVRQHLAQKRSEQETDSDVFSESTTSSLSNMSDITFYSKVSATSLYSTATQTGPLSSVRLEKKALRRKQKESKKRIREGHPREEEAIVAYIRKLLPSEFTLRRTEKLIRALLFVQKTDLATILLVAFREYVSEALTLPEDVLGEERARLDALFKDWNGGLPSAMRFVQTKDEDESENGWEAS